MKASPSIFAALLVVSAAGAQDPSVAPPNPEGVGITEHLGERIPLDLTFTDEDGRSVAIGDYFDGERPVLLTLVYYRCPSLCNALLTGLTYSLKELDWSAGGPFEIVTVSIDPTEDSKLASAKKASYLAQYDRAGAESGWHFLVGDEKAIETLADTVGFEYRYQERTGLFTHAATLMVITPDGRLSRYFNDVMFEPDALRRSLDDAAQGIVGTPPGHTLLRWCYVYDPSAGKYVVRARRIMTMGGALILLVTATGLGLFWRREFKRHRIETEAHS